MRCSRRSGVAPCVIILLFSSQQLALFSARSARAKGSGDPAPVPLILWTPYPLPAPGLRARTRDTHICIRKRYVNQQVGAPCDAPFVFVGAGHAPPAARNQHTQPHQNTKYVCSPCRGRPVCRPAAHMLLPCTGAHTGAPLQGSRHVRHLCRVEACLDRRSNKRAGAPAGGPRRSFLQFQTPSLNPAKRFGCGHCPQCGRQGFR